MQHLPSGLLRTADQLDVQEVCGEVGLPDTSTKKPNTLVPVAQVGWVCPCCNSVYGPHVDLCSGCDTDKNPKVPYHIIRDLTSQLATAIEHQTANPAVLLDRFPFSIICVTRALEAIKPRARPKGRLLLIDDTDGS